MEIEPERLIERKSNLKIYRRIVCRIKGRSYWAYERRENENTMVVLTGNVYKRCSEIWKKF